MWDGGTRGEMMRAFVSYDISDLIVKSHSCVPLTLIRECRNGMTMHVQGWRNDCFGSGGS